MEFCFLGCWGSQSSTENFYIFAKVSYFWCFFLMISCLKRYIHISFYIVVSTLKSEKTLLEPKRLQMGISNPNVLQKGPLMQDCVFRLGLHHKPKRQALLPTTDNFENNLHLTLKWWIFSKTSSEGSSKNKKSGPTNHKCAHILDTYYFRYRWCEKKSHWAAHHMVSEIKKFEFLDFEFNFKHLVFMLCSHIKD